MGYPVVTQPLYRRQGLPCRRRQPPYCRHRVPYLRHVPLHHRQRAWPPELVQLPSAPLHLL
ncbi:hypothetical protein BGY98DRAFT_1030203, partial [Russula aff. rugulosa BPL654]